MSNVSADPSIAEQIVTADLEQMCVRGEAELATMAGSRFLLTGGAGFLGYYLVQMLLTWNRAHDPLRQINVTVLDNYSRGVPEWLQGRETDTSLRLFQHDVTKPLPEAIGEFDYVVHAASIASPTFYRQYPLETMDANVNGLRHLLDSARARQDAGNPLRGLLFFSTSEIYGDPPAAEIPTRETYRGNVSCTGPRACYDESKRYGETLCVTFAERYGVPVRVARPFNNYGPGLRITDRRVVADFARDILAGRDIVLLSDGSPSRTFCYVADAVIGYIKVLVRGRNGEAYNIGVEEPEITVDDLAERLTDLGRALFQYSGRVVRGRDPDKRYLIDNPQRRRPSIAKARQELGYDPCISLDDGLRRTLLWYASAEREKAA
jgi:dTDP-glucose 4,6-dehydratase/UDP-glucuronate decarboxylase